MLLLGCLSLLLFKHSELCTRGKVLTVLRGEGSKTQVAGTLRAAEVDCLFSLVVFKLSLDDSIAPSLAVHRQLHAVVLDVAISRVLTWQVGKAF